MYTPAPAISFVARPVGRVRIGRGSGVDMAGAVARITFFSVNKMSEMTQKRKNEKGAYTDYRIVMYTNESKTSV